MGNLKEALSCLNPGALILEERCRICKETVEADLIRSSKLSDNSPLKKCIHRLDTIFGAYPISEYKTLCISCSSKLETEPCRLTLMDQRDSKLKVLAKGRYQKGLRSLIRTLKYEDDRLISSDLALLLARAIEELETGAIPTLKQNPNRTVLVPVPLHPRKLARRGFNQAELIALELGRILNLRVETTLITRVKETSAQYNLSRLERQINLANAFSLTRQPTKGNSYVLVDDLTTTGTTIKECARVLRNGGGDSSQIELALVLAG